MENKKMSLLLGGYVFLSAALFFLGGSVSAQDYTFEACRGDGGDEAYCSSFPRNTDLDMSDMTMYDADYFKDFDTEIDSYEGCMERWDDAEYCSGKASLNDYQNYMSAGTCKVDADCGSGFECYSGKCIDSGSYGGTTSWTDRLWEGTKDLGTSLWDSTAGKAIPSWSIGGSIGGSGTGSAGGMQVNLPGINYGGNYSVPTGGSSYSGGYPSGSANQMDPGAGGALYSGANPAGVAGAGIFNQPKCGSTGEFQDIGGVCFPTQTGLSDAPVGIILANVFGWLMGIFTTLSFMAFVISGIQYLTSAGDQKQIDTAKTNAKWSVIGVMVGLSGYIVVKAVSAALSGQSYFF